MKKFENMKYFGFVSSLSSDTQIYRNVLYDMNSSLIFFQIEKDNKLWVHDDFIDEKENLYNLSLTLKNNTKYPIELIKNYIREQKLKRILK